MYYDLLSFIYYKHCNKTKTNHLKRLIILQNKAVKIVAGGQRKVGSDSYTILSPITSLKL